MSYDIKDLVRTLEDETGVTWSAERIASCCALSPSIPVAPLAIGKASLGEDRAAALAFVARWNEHWLEVARARYRAGDMQGSRCAGLLLESAELRDKVLRAGRPKTEVAHADV